MSEKREVDIKSLLKWSEPKTVKNGTLLLRKASPTPEFWTIWKQNKQALKDVGISCKPVGSAWEVLWFQPVNPEQHRADKAQREQNVVASRAADAVVDFPHPAGLEYLGYQKAGIAFILRAWGREDLLCR